MYHSLAYAAALHDKGYKVLYELVELLQLSSEAPGV